ncbi:DUF368 domain-containing protein [Mycetocola reblochoni]|uniref:DUF368 domain-containing protein n=1 Tax=Mycetocola reblochoni TaxID=331618 RepID=UPI003F95D432
MRYLIDLLRGALIGMAEIVPGISGGTVALIVGVYETVIASADQLIRGVVRGAADLVRGRGAARAREHFARVSWGVLLPLGVGMVTAVVLGAAVLGPLVESHPVQTRAVMLGLMAVSLIVPIRLVGPRWRAGEVLLAVVAAVGAFLLTGLPAGTVTDPPMILVAASAAIAVCALVLPGTSGSFLLLVFGMYAPTLAAVNDRDIGYLAVFMLGAVCGLALFVSGLRWLLATYHRVTFAVATGLMAGSLRALWPWQDADRGLQAPGDDLGVVTLMFLIGAAAVAALLIAESALVRRKRASGAAVLD